MSSISFSQNSDFKISFDVVYGTGEKLPYYDGAYNVTPKTTSQTLATKNKSMADDIKVLEIPYNETHNTNGITVTIGGV